MTSSRDQSRDNKEHFENHYISEADCRIWLKFWMYIEREVVQTKTHITCWYCNYVTSDIKGAFFNLLDLLNYMSDSDETFQVHVTLKPIGLDEKWHNVQMKSGDKTYKPDHDILSKKLK